MIENLTNEQNRLNWNRGTVDDQFEGVQPYGHIIRLENSYYIDGTKPVIESPFDSEDLAQLYSYFTERLEATNILSDDYYAGPMIWDGPRYLAGFVTKLFYGVEWGEKGTPKIDNTINVADTWLGKSLCYEYGVTDKAIIACYYALKITIG